VIEVRCKRDRVCAARGVFARVQIPRSKNEPALGFVVHFYGTTTWMLHRSLTTMNVQRIESTTLASSVPILLAHSVGIRLRRKVRRDVP